MTDASEQRRELSFDSVEALLLWLLQNPRRMLEAIVSLYRKGKAAEAEKIATAGIALLPGDRQMWFQHGMVAIHLGDWGKAADRFAAGRERFPDFAPFYGFGGMALRRSGQVEAAEALLQDAIRKFPDDAQVFAEYAQCGSGRVSPEEQMRRARMVLERFPQRPEGFWMVGGALMANQRFDEADAVLAEGIGRHPNDPLLLFVWARCATVHRDWPEATRRWEVAKSRLPNSRQIADGYLGMRMQASADDARPFIEWARQAPADGPRDQAIRRWSEVKKRFPDCSDGYWILTTELLRASRLEEAETTIQEGIQRLPHDPYVLWQWGRVATKRHDWAEAERRWQVGQARHPKFDQFKEGIAEMQLARQLLELQEADAPAVAAGGAEMGKLLARFESLGDNCEFGIVQRLAGIEPLGLLRWSNIQPAKLVQILNNGFEGVGEPENTELMLTVTGDYHLIDPRYFGMHTFINSGHASAEDLLPKMCRRLRFLKDKLIEDLRDGEKIFVHKSTWDSMTPDKMRAIKAAIRRYGNGVLLCVQRPPVPNLDKSVEVVEDGLLVGYLSRLTPDPQAARHYAADWFALCQRAEQLVAASAPQGMVA